MSNVIPMQHHEYDLLLGHRSPTALRLNDAEHRNIQVGDLVEFHGHNSIMDRERFKVVGKMNHPTLQSAINSVQHSSLSTTDKIKLTNSFMNVHGPQSIHQPVVGLHLAPHPGPPAFNRSLGTLG